MMGIEFGIHLHAIGVKMNGAAGENRTHDLSLTKGLRYHYATAATGPKPVFKGALL